MSLYIQTKGKHCYNINVNRQHDTFVLHICVLPISSAGDAALLQAGSQLTSAVLVHNQEKNNRRHSLSHLLSLPVRQEHSWFSIETINTDHR